MGVISSNSFDPAHGYVGVRLQQGVPIVDRDWNEMEDIRKFELRAFLKWFVGDGVPTGSDAFRIDSPGSSTDANDFIIRAGASAPPAGVSLSNLDKGLYFAGNCLVDGLEAVITGDIKFTNQPLHASQPGSSALAAAWNVPTIAAISLPTAANTSIVVYLDVWERLVTPTEDPTNLILPGLGTESCARLKREWAVRARTPTAAEPTIPVLGGPDYLEGHSYFALASISSQTSATTVNPGDITDLRRARLTLADLVRRVSLLDIPAFNPAPQFSPTRGKAGDTVTLYGRNFTVGGTPQVMFGTVTVLPANVGFTLDKATGIAVQATVPANVVGPLDPRDVNITITTGGGIAASQARFTVIGPPAFGPTGHQFTPTSGKVGTVVTLSGNNFDDPTLQVEFVVPGEAPLPAPIVTGSATATQVKVTVPQPSSPFTTVLFTNFTVQTSLGGPVTSSDTFQLTP